ncbi:MAG: OmpA family protein [Saprospiraceae bacterium]
MTNLTSIFKMAAAALLLTAFIGCQSGSSDANKAADKMGDAASDMADTSTKSINDMVKDIQGLTIDASGNLVDKTGNTVAKAGAYMKDKAGNIVDAAGNIIYQASNGAITATQNTANMTAEAAKGIEADIADAAEGEVIYFVSEDGNLVDQSGKVILEKGEFSKSEDGYYVDKKGNRIGRVFKKIGKAIVKAGEAVGDAVGDAAGAVGGAVSGAAKKTGEFFSGIFKKKDRAGYTHTLENIEFEPKSHRITNFSKAEVQGLSYALQQNPDAKIEVQAYTTDGRNSKKSEALSLLRAKVVEDMLVTFGVDRKQISSKGMGDSNKDKASDHKMEIVVK